MKRRTVKIGLTALLFVCLSSACILAGCGGEAHTHAYSEDWAFDSESHWHYTTCGHDARKDIAAHSFTSYVIAPTRDKDGYTLHACACGYAYKDSTVGATGEPVFDATAWAHDDATHWHPATGTSERGDEAAHDFILCKIAPTHDSEGYTAYLCKVCGYENRTNILAKGHTYEEGWTSDEYSHWHKTSCCDSEERGDEYDHSFGEGDRVCVVCGKEISPRLEYTLASDGASYIVTGLGCIDSTEIEVPSEYRGKSVSRIASTAFAGTDIQKIFVPSGVRLSENAFSGCTALNAITLPNGIDEIPTGAFRGCTALTALNLPETVTKIGDFAFSGCNELNAITLPNGIDEIATGAFRGCTALITLNLPASVTKIGDFAFYECEDTTIDLSALTQLTSVGFSALNGCKNIQSVPATLTFIGQYAFAHSNIESISIPSGAVLEQQSFYDCASLTTVTAACAELPANAFEDCIRLETVTLTGVERIGAEAFKGCALLSALTLPETVYAVGADAFTGTGLITTENGVQYAANVAVGYVSSTSVSLKDGTVGIADGVFREKEVTGVTLADTVRFIGASAFRKCTSLTSVTLPASVTRIGANAFRESGLTSVDVPATVKSVGDNAFYDCAYLTTVSVHAENIGKFAFSYTGVGRDLDHPVKQRPDYAKITSVTVGATVREIGSNAFQYCPITSLTLPDGTQKVGAYAFAQTDVSSVILSGSVCEVGEYAFYGCEQLTSLTLQNKTGWTAHKTAIAESRLTAQDDAATLFTSTYVDCVWKRA